MTTLPGFRDSSRWLWILLALLGLGAGVATVSYRPAKRWVTVRNARRLAQEAQRAVDDRLWVTSSEKVKAALRFAPTEPSVLRVAARFLALNGQAKALDYWGQLVTGGNATLEDRHDLIRLSLQVSRPDLAQSELNELLRLNPTNQVTQELALDLLVATGRWTAAEIGAAEVIRNHPNSATAALVFALANLRGSAPEKVTAGISELNLLAADERPVGVAALKALASSDRLPAPERIVRAEALISHRAAQLADRLEGAGVLWNLQPTGRLMLAERVTSLLTSEHTEPDLIAVADWLRQHEETARADALLPAAGVGSSEALFLARLELLSDQKQWAESTSLIDSVRKKHSGDAIACAAAKLAFERGRPDEVKTQLASALESAGARWNRVAFIANYALTLGQTNIALDAWNRLLDEPRNAFSAANNILAHLPDKSFADFEQRASRALARLQPRDDELQAQQAYFDLLGGENVDRSLETFQRLAGAHPNSPNLSIGMAFALLRKNKLEQSLSLIESLKLDWNESEAHHRAIYSSILAANHQLRDARVMAEGINPKQLRPLELKLIHDLVANR